MKFPRKTPITTTAMSTTTTATIAKTSTTSQAISPTTRPKYFHQLQPPPLDLPEVICCIRSYLTLEDIKKCMLVCYTWAKQFGPFLWETIYYSRLIEQDDPALKRNGHLIHHLHTFALRDKDLQTIALRCPNLSSILLEIESLQDPGSLHEMISSVNRLEKLSFKLLNPNGAGVLQCALLEPIAWGRLNLLTELRLIGFYSPNYAPLYYTKMILRCLEGCPQLRELELSGVRLVDSVDQIMDAIRNSYSSANSVQTTILEAHARPFAGSAFSWLPWRKKVTEPRFVSASEAAAKPSSTGRVAAWSSSTIAAILSEGSGQKFESIEPNEDYKSPCLTTIKLADIFVNPMANTDFVATLLKRCPNLTYLSLIRTSAKIDDLDALCPKLRTFIMEGYNAFPVEVPQPNITHYLTHHVLHSDENRLMGLRALRLSMCALTDQDLESMDLEFKRYRLKHLEITCCTQLTALGLARFLAECWSLETVWTDRLLLQVPSPDVLPHRNRSRNVSISAGPSINVSDVGHAIRWGCNQIRYLDVFWGHKASKDSFEHILLDLISRLDKLEFLGLETPQIRWLMECEPILYTKPDRQRLERQGLEHTTTQQAYHSYKAHRFEKGDPLPLGLFGSVKTLSLEAGCCLMYGYNDPERQNSVLDVDQVKYLYDAFPALENISSSKYNLPDNWELRWSRSRNLPYFYNRVTTESRWQAPPGVDADVVHTFQRDYQNQHQQQPQGESTSADQKGNGAER
ncbi:hypothetical protein BX616_009620, partial [Lobosporangium transversale]